MESDDLVLHAIRERSACNDTELDLELHHALPSTNHYLASKTKENTRHVPLAVIADSQTAGVGRRGKQWVSEPGNISFSLSYCFAMAPHQLMGLSLVTGLSVANVLQTETNLQCQLKWPNDILVDGAKLAGILIELPKSSMTSTTVVCGIGINYRSLTRELDLGQAVASVTEHSHHTVSRNTLIGGILAELLSNFALYSSEGLAPFLKAWDTRDYLHGQAVNIHLQDRIIQGIACGISDTGELLVDVAGKVSAFQSGEVSVRRR